MELVPADGTSYVVVRTDKEGVASADCQPRTAPSEPAAVDSNPRPPVLGSPELPVLIGPPAYGTNGISLHNARWDPIAGAAGTRLWARPCRTVACRGF